jgi:hypothetical protein
MIGSVLALVSAGLLVGLMLLQMRARSRDRDRAVVVYPRLLLDSAAIAPPTPISSSVPGSGTLTGSRGG